MHSYPLFFSSFLIAFWVAHATGHNILFIMLQVFPWRFKQMIETFVLREIPQLDIIQPIFIIFWIFEEVIYS